MEAVSAEVLTVLAAMRLNQRHRSESRLIRGFKKVLSESRTLDVAQQLRPFLEVIRSEEASGPSTGAALRSVDRLLLVGTVQLDSPSASSAMAEICQAVMFCRFEETDADSDEVVLMHILRVLRTCITLDVGWLLQNECVDAMVQTCYRMCREARRSQLLRCLAEQAMLDIVRSLFSRLITMDPAPATQADAAAPSSGDGSADFVVVTEQPPQPYDYRAVESLMAFLCALAEPKADTDSSTSRLGLELIDAALSIGGQQLERFPTLQRIVQEELSLYLVQHSTTKDLQLYAAVLRLVVKLCNFQKASMHLQVQTFVSKVYLPALNANPDEPNERRDLALCSLLKLCQSANFLGQLFYKYDCDQNSEDVLEQLVIATVKCTAAESAVSRVTAVDTLAAMLCALADRCDGKELEEDAEERLAVCRQRKARKRTLQAGAKVFNEKPKKGLMFLENSGILPNPYTPADVASLLRNTPSLHKTMIGEYFGEPSDFNLAVLDEFIKTFHFGSQKFDAALRMFLQSFRLPGEAQKIDRVMQAFADKYFEECPNAAWTADNLPVFASADGAYVLAFSTIMLNTDRHSTQIKDKISLEQFLRNNRGINDGETFPADFMEDLFNSISTNEIRMSDETGEMQYVAWVDMLRQQEKRSALSEVWVEGDANFDADIFALTWGRAGGAEAMWNFFLQANDVEMQQRALDAVAASAKLAFQYQRTDILDNLVHQLCLASPLLSDVPTTLPALGSSSREQLATVALFGVARLCGGQVRAAWRGIFRCTVHAVRLQLAPGVTKLLKDDGIHDTTGASPTLRSMAAASEQALDTKEPDAGLWSMVSGFIATSLGVDDEEANQSDATLTGQNYNDVRSACLKVVSDCKLESVLASCGELSAEALSALADVLISELPLEQAPVVDSAVQQSGVQYKGVDFPPPAASDFGPLTPTDSALYVDLLAVVAVESATHRQWEVCSKILAHLSALLTHSKPASMLSQHALQGLLRVLILFKTEPAVSDMLRDTIKMLVELPASLLQPLDNIISAGLYSLLQSGFGSFRADGGSPWPWKETFQLLKRGATASASSASCSFASMSLLIVDAARFKLSVQKSSFAACIEALLTFTERGGFPEMESDSHLHCGRNSPKQQSTDTYICVKKSVIRADFDMDSEKIGDLNVGGQIEVVETRTRRDDGRVRLRYERGWVSLTGAKGSSLLTLQVAEASDTSSKSTALIAQVDGTYGTNDSSGSDEETTLTFERPPQVSGNHKRPRLALELLFAIYQRLDCLGSDRATEDGPWTEYWIPLLKAMGSMCLDDRDEVRVHALATLHKALMANQTMKLPASAWIACLLQVLVPLVDELIRKGPDSEKTRLRALMLICKLFLHQLPVLSKSPNFSLTWFSILRCMDKSLKAPGTELPGEAVPESLKNVLLVMISMGVLVDGQGNASDEMRIDEVLWQTTWQQIDEFCPDMRNDPDIKAEADHWLAAHAPPSVATATEPAEPEPQPAAEVAAEVPAADATDSEPAASEEPAAQDTAKSDEPAEPAAEPVAAKPAQDEQQAAEPKKSSGGMFGGFFG